MTVVAALAACGEFVLDFLDALVLERGFVAEMALGERIDRLQLLSLFRPLPLAVQRRLRLLAHRLVLRVDGFIKAAEEGLVVLPFVRRQAVLCRLLKALRVFAAVLFEHFELGFRVLFARDQASEVLRRFVRACLHQFEHGLQGERLGHGLATGAKEREQLIDARFVTSFLGQRLLQKTFERRVQLDRFVE